FGGEALDKETMRRRVELARTGVVIVSVVLGRDGTCLYGPSVRARGVPGLDTVPEAVMAVERGVRECLRRRPGSSSNHTEEEIRRAARRALTDWSGTRPVVVVQMLQAEDSRRA